MPSISKFCERMRYWCEDANLGYDQSNRWNIVPGGECDCSSLVIHALKEAGFDTGSASYTGDLSENLTARGWKRLPANISTCKPGDILLNDWHHVCVVISGSGGTAIIAQASIDENGRATGGASGDQIDGETNTRQIYVYSRGWDCILRFGGSSSDVITNKNTGKLAVDGKLKKADIIEWQAQCGTIADGCISGQLKDCQSSFPALAAVTFEGTGSDLMRKVQKHLGISPNTGVIASGTIAMIQGWLYLHGHSCAKSKAGVLDEWTARAIQESLNAGEWHEVL